MVHLGLTRSSGQPGRVFLGASGKSSWLEICEANELVRAEVGGVFVVV